MNIKPRISVRATYLASTTPVPQVIQFRMPPDTTWGQVYKVARVLTGRPVLAVGTAPTADPVATQAMLPWRAYCPGHEPVEILEPSFEAAMRAAQELFQSPDARVISALVSLPKVCNAGQEGGLNYVRIEKIGGAA